MFDKPRRRGMKGGLNLATLLLIFLALLLVANASALDKRVSKGSRQSQGLSLEERLELEQQLSDLGYWTGPIDGLLDSASRHALIAFQKVEGRPRTGVANRSELRHLQTANRPVPRHTGYPHVEVDLDRQVLFVVDDTDSITRILPVCSGNEKLYIDRGKTHRAHTPTGMFKVQRKIAGWRRSSLGLLYYPSYFHQGIAVHGSPSMSVYPASHGCIRIPMFAAKELSQMMPVGLDVIVYRS
jgi:hypothetical protein